MSSPLLSDVSGKINQQQQQKAQLHFATVLARARKKSNQCTTPPTSKASGPKD